MTRPADDIPVSPLGRWARGRFRMDGDTKGRTVADEPTKLLAEWFWVDRWTGSSAFGLSAEARGVYREMLTQAWRRGARLPNDHETICRYCGLTSGEWERSWPKIKRYWRADGEDLVNDTQLEVYADALGRHERASSRGRKGAQALAQARLKRVPKPKPPSPSPSPSLSPKPTPIADAGNGHDLFGATAPPPPPEAAPKHTLKSLSKRLQVLSGSSAKVCTAQIQTLREHKATDDSIADAIETCELGMDAWAWMRKVSGRQNGFPNRNEQAVDTVRRWAEKDTGS